MRAGRGGPEKGRGGGATLFGGPGYQGGNLNLYAGRGDKDGGTVYLAGGDGSGTDATGYGGGAEVSGGWGMNGGGVYITGGTGKSLAGRVVIKGGEASTNTGEPGDVEIRGGRNNNGVSIASDASNGRVVILGGETLANGINSGGDVEIAGGPSTSATQKGGDLVLSPGINGVDPTLHGRIFLENLPTVPFADEPNALWNSGGILMLGAGGVAGGGTGGAVFDAEELNWGFLTTDITLGSITSTSSGIKMLSVDETRAISLIHGAQGLFISYGSETAWQSDFMQFYTDVTQPFINLVQPTNFTNTAKLYRGVEVRDGQYIRGEARTEVDHVGSRFSISGGSGKGTGDGGALNIIGGVSFTGPKMGTITIGGSGGGTSGVSPTSGGDVIITHSFVGTGAGSTGNGGDVIIRRGLKVGDLGLDGNIFFENLPTVAQTDPRAVWDNAGILMLGAGGTAGGGGTFTGGTLTSPLLLASGPSSYVPISTPDEPGGSSMEGGDLILSTGLGDPVAVLKAGDIQLTPGTGGKIRVLADLQMSEGNIVLFEDREITSFFNPLAGDSSNIILRTADSTGLAGRSGDIRLIGGVGPTYGGGITIASGAGASGGPILISAGASRQDDFGGAPVVIKAGQAQGVGGWGGNVEIMAGATTGDGGGGHVEITGGGGGVGDGGDVILNGAPGTATARPGGVQIKGGGGHVAPDSHGGSVNIKGGDAATQEGGDIILTAGATSGLFRGGAVVLTAGRSDLARGGDASVTGGHSSTTEKGGDAVLTGGRSDEGLGGDVRLAPGAGPLGAGVVKMTLPTVAQADPEAVWNNAGALNVGAGASGGGGAGLPTTGGELSGNLTMGVATRLIMESGSSIITPDIADMGTRSLTLAGGKNTASTGSSVYISGGEGLFGGGGVELKGGPAIAGGDGAGGWIYLEGGAGDPTFSNIRGKIRFGFLPTQGQTIADAIWNNGGVINIGLGGVAAQEALEARLASIEARLTALGV
jgi:hypothetical protein